LAYDSAAEREANVAKRTQRTRHEVPAPDRERPAAAPAGDTRVLLAFLLSGAAGLMHQVVWAKLLVQLTGASAYAQAVVLAVFMGGLAVGSLLFGRRVDRLGRALRTYVRLEVAIGLYCLGLPLLVALAREGFAALATRFFEAPGAMFGLRLLVALVVVLPPAVLMGATLPVLARRLVGRVEETQRAVANLYALNSVGAVFGTALAGFVTLPLLGIRGSLAVAATLNFAAGGCVLTLARHETDGPVPRPGLAGARPPEPAGAGYGPAQYRASLVALALSGFAAMGYEVVFVRIISLSFGASAQSFTVMLMCFIAGIALGSGIVARRTIPRPLWWLAVSQLAVASAFLLVTPLISRMPYLIGLMRIRLTDVAYGFAIHQLAKALLCLVVLVVPTACLGFGFPLVARVQARRAQEVGSRVGSTYAWNTIGNVLGVIVTSLVLLPRVGLLGAFHVNLACTLAAALVFLLAAREARAVERLRVGIVTVALVAGYLAIGTGWIEPIVLGAGHLRMNAPEPTDVQHPSRSFAAWRNQYVTRRERTNRFYLGEDAHATVQVYGEIYEGQQQTYLFVNGKPDSATVGDLSTLLLLAHAPLFLVPDARSVLVIGYGTGITLGSVLCHPVQRADVVEISHAVLGAYPIYADENHHALEDPRVHVHIDDGQSFLRAVPYTYDVIISEPSNPWITGIGGLFTVDFFEAARRKLSPHGVFTLWLEAYGLDPDSVRLVMRTFRSVFPHVIAFVDESFGDGILVGSVEPIEPDFARMEARYDEPEVRNDLARLDIDNLASFLTYHRGSEQAVAAIAGTGPVNTFDHEALEYEAPRSLFYRRSSGRLFYIMDPYVRKTDLTEVLFGQYVDYRRARGEPVSKEELFEVAAFAHNRREAGNSVAEAVFARVASAPRRTVRPSRPARGAVPEPTQMGLYEALYRARRLARAELPEKAVAYYRRALELQPNDALLVEEAADASAPRPEGDEPAAGDE
jgi:spermidine synthase